MKQQTTQAAPAEPSPEHQQKTTAAQVKTTTAEKASKLRKTLWPDDRCFVLSLN